MEINLILINDIYIKILNNELNTQKDWDNLCIDYKLSEDAIKEFKDKWNWLLLIKKQILSEEFIEKKLEQFNHKFSWVYLCRYQNLSNDFKKNIQIKLNTIF